MYHVLVCACQILMHAPQLLNHVSHIFDTRTQPLNHQLLSTLVQVQEPLHHFTIDKPEWGLGFPSLVPKRAPCVEVELAGSADVLLQP